MIESIDTGKLFIGIGAGLMIGSLASIYTTTPSAPALYYSGIGVLSIAVYQLGIDLGEEA